MGSAERVAVIRLVDCVFAIGRTAAPKFNLGGTWLGKFMWPALPERSFLPTITFVSTPPCEELLTGETLFSGDPFV